MQQKQQTDHLAELIGPGGRFEVVATKIGGRSLHVYKDRPPSLRTYLEAAARRPERTHLVQGDVRYTFAETLARIGSLAASLAELGVVKGDRVALLAANAPDWMIGYWATVSMGAIAVPLNAWWKAEELEFVLQDCGAKVLFCDPRRYQTVEPVLDRLAALEHVAVFGEDAAGRAQAFEPLASGRAEAALPDVAIDEDDPSAIIYTSGTTGRPKGAIQTHRITIANFMNMKVAAHLGAKRSAESGKDPDRPKPRPTEQNCWLAIVPFFHVTGLNSIAIPAMATGGKIVILPPGRFDPELAMRTMAAEEVTTLAGVPTIMTRLLESPAFGSHDMRSLKTISYGGAPPPSHLVARLAEHFPWLVGGGPSTVYGLTEAAAVVATNTGADHRRKPESCGHPVATVEVKIMGSDGREAPVGERGEILAKGPTISPGYWNRPEDNAKTFADGWFHTGDIGKVDEEGFLYILDRAKDMIIRGGENIYCIEIEDVIDQHPDVVECAVVGVSHEDWGEEVKAVVVVREGSALDEQAVKDHCSERLANYKVPTYVDLATEPLPRNPAGKVLKQALRGSEHTFVEDATSDSTL